MISRIFSALLGAAIVTGCGTQDKGAAAASTTAAPAVASTTSTKQTDGWSTVTTESSMDGKKIIASKKFGRLSADGVTKSTIKVALTCTVTSKSLTLAMRAVDYDKQLKSEMPTQFDSELTENLNNVPVGRFKSKNIKPLPMSKVFALQQSDLVVWDISNLAMLGTLDGLGNSDDALATKNQLLLNIEQIAFGNPFAAEYADLNSMFSAERPWVFEVSSGRDPFEITIPADSDGVNEVLRTCGAYPALLVHSREVKTAESNAKKADEQQVADVGAPHTPNAAPIKQQTATDAATTSGTVKPQGDPKDETSAVAARGESNNNSNNEIEAKPSFDCTKASTAVEKMICDTPTLAAADAEMAAEYKRMYAAAGPNSVSVKQGQRDFILKRNQCSTVECIADAYRARRTVLAQLGS